MNRPAAGSSLPAPAGSSPELLEEVLAAGRRRGLLGPGPVADHVHHARGFWVAFGQERAGQLPLAGGARGALDLGSGAGLPGLVLAVEEQSLEMTLLEANARRADFLRWAVGRLGCGGRVRVVEERAERAGRRPELRGAFALVTSRGFGPPAVTAECGAPFLGTGGLLVVSGPPVTDPSGRWPDRPLSELGLVRRKSVVQPAHYQVLEQAVPCPERYPRRDGVPAKRPLF